MEELFVPGSSGGGGPDIDTSNKKSFICFSICNNLVTLLEIELILGLI